MEKKRFNHPQEAYEYIVEQELEMDVLHAMMRHVWNFSIAEIADGSFECSGEKVFFSSPGYKVRIEITDEEIKTAVRNQLYVSAFFSRQEENCRMHFLVSMYPVSMKARFEEEIAKEVVSYMLLAVIRACRLDTDEKIHNYVSQ